VNVVLDTNIWISYFMARKHVELVNIVYDYNLKIFTDATLVRELADVLNRPKIKKYINIEISELVNFHKDLCYYNDTILKYNNSPDPNDNFLFDLAIQTNSEYVVIGDKKILETQHPDFTFVSMSYFENIIFNLKSQKIKTEKKVGRRTVIRKLKK